MTCHIALDCNNIDVSLLLLELKIDVSRLFFKFALIVHPSVQSSSLRSLSIL